RIFGHQISVVGAEEVRESRAGCESGVRAKLRFVAPQSCTPLHQSDSPWKQNRAPCEPSSLRLLRDRKAISRQSPTRLSWDHRSTKSSSSSRLLHLAIRFTEIFSSDMASDLAASLFHPSELYAIFSFLASPDPSRQFKKRPSSKASNRDWCYYFLNLTSRSFARVIQELNDEMRHPVCIFYLVLRGLDTVEDDMTLPKARKLAVLRSFHELIYQRGWTFTENGPDEKDRELLVMFDKVIEEFLGLAEKYRAVIADITKRMAAGMADFIEGKKVVTMDDYNLYTHYVAGLVGHGLTGLFIASGLEPQLSALSRDRALFLSNQMGLMLQKINILRDFSEDVPQGRVFWPKDVWGKYVANVEDMLEPRNLELARACLNDLCGDALSLVPDSLEYLSLLRDPTIFRFCAIPQTMAISTLTLVLDNPKNFRMPLLKIRKGQACEQILGSGDFDSVRVLYLRELRAQAAKVFGIVRRGGEDVKRGTVLDLDIALGKAESAVRHHDKIRDVFTTEKGTTRPFPFTVHPEDPSREVARKRASSSGSGSWAVVGLAVVVVAVGFALWNGEQGQQ
ncbi:farnesyl-diphosphate farnesyltransferase, partial [Gonapodya prolifera JEL478]